MAIKKIIMLHYVMPGALGGPNVSSSRIEESELLSNKYHFVRLNQNRLAGGRVNLSLILELRREIVKERPDIIHISGMQSAGFHVMVAAFLAGCKKRLISTHGFSGSAIKLSWWKRFAFNYIFEPLTLMMATHVHCISRFTQNHKLVQKFAKHKSTQIYNLPPVVKNKASYTRGEMRNHLNISDRDIVFITVARVVLDKGFETLACAIRKFRDYANVKFIIVGDGSYRAEFVNLVNDEITKRKVMILGSRNDVFDILKACDVFVLPTLHENLGNVFLEAGLAKLPTVATHVGGVPEVIKDGETGILVPPNDDESLFQAMKCFADDESQCEKYGEKAYEYIMNNFESDRLAAQFYELYSSILQSK